jgi:hypothetical protein
MNDKIEITGLRSLLPFACKDSFGRCVVKFGNYPFDTDEKKQPIEWLLLNANTYEQEEGGLLLSKYVIDCVRYYHDCGEAKKWVRDNDEHWKHSDIGYWLNGSKWQYRKYNTYPSSYRNDFFIDNAFNNEELEIILDKDGLGKIRLLSVDEARKYFEANIKTDNGWCTELYTNDRKYTYSPLAQAESTKYAQAQTNDDVQILVIGGKYHEEYDDYVINKLREYEKTEEFLGKAWWWLRSVGASSGCASDVRGPGEIYDGDGGCVDGSNGVRPALWIKL